MTFKTLKELHDAAKRYEIIRRMNPQEYKAIFIKHLSSNLSFDDMIDSLADKYQVKKIIEDDFVEKIVRQSKENGVY